MLRPRMPPLSPPGVPPVATIPGQLARFTLLEIIGRGSMGVVYRSFDPRHHRPVAVKVLDAERLAGDGSYRQQLRAEAAAAHALAHPGIVAVYEYGETEALAYLVMEYVRGVSLRARLAQGERFSLGRALDLGRQLLEALAHAHHAGVWHRDVKPGNFLVTGRDRAKLTDFGIARHAAQPSHAADEVLGSAGYVAPETYLTDASDARADLFAAGAVLYELLAGIPAYRGTRAEIMFRVCSGAPPAPSVASGRPQLQPFDAVLLRALAREPGERFGSAEQFLEALGAAARA